MKAPVAQALLPVLLLLLRNRKRPPQYFLYLIRPEPRPTAPRAPALQITLPAIPPSSPARTHPQNASPSSVQPHSLRPPAPTTSPAKSPSVPQSRTAQSNQNSANP